jgi:hypothetical protein
MSSLVRRELEEYAAGRGEAARVVAAVMEAYYRERDRGKWDALRPLIEVIERAAPGVVELAAAGDTPGFRVRLAERHFPDQYATELRVAAGVALREWSPSTEEASRVAPPAPPAPGLLQRVFGAIRRLFGG